MSNMFQWRITPEIHEKWYDLDGCKLVKPFYGSTLRLGFKLWTCGKKTRCFHGDFRSFSLMFLSGLLRTFTCLLCSMFFYCLAAAMFSWKQILFYWYYMIAYHPNGFGFAWRLGRRRLGRAHWLCQTLLECENLCGFPKEHIHSASFSFPFEFVAYHVLLHFFGNYWNSFKGTRKFLVFTCTSSRCWVSTWQIRAQVWDQNLPFDGQLQAANSLHWNQPGWYFSDFCTGEVGKMPVGQFTVVGSCADQML